jgi:uncharacterized NAD(P)/FAD-binding protein YdhS
MHLKSLIDKKVLWCSLKIYSRPTWPRNTVVHWGGHRWTVAVRVASAVYQKAREVAAIAVFEGLAVVVAAAAAAAAAAADDDVVVLVDAFPIVCERMVTNVTRRPPASVACL